VFPGGFSYGDDVAAGRVFGLELRHGARAHLSAFVDRGGTCSACATGSRCSSNRGSSSRAARAVRRAAVALYDNASNRFECRWITLRAEKCAATWLEAGALLPCPVAHGEGRFVVRDENVLRRLQSKGQIALRYARADGQPAIAYPDNPNGSVHAIAGICDPTGRVLGLMPHPERNVDPWHHPHWTRAAAGVARREGEGLDFYSPARGGVLRRALRAH
jgi:phosphoribosylformylglycinamidine synthase